MFIKFLSINSGKVIDADTPILDLFPAEIGDTDKAPITPILFNGTGALRFESATAISNNGQVMINRDYGATDWDYVVKVNHLENGRYVTKQVIQPPRPEGNFGLYVHLVDNETGLVVFQNSDSGFPAKFYYYQKNGQGTFDYVSEAVAPNATMADWWGGYTYFSTNLNTIAMVSKTDYYEEQETVSVIAIWTRDGSVWSAPTLVDMESSRKTMDDFGDQLFAMAGDGLSFYYMNGMYNTDVVLTGHRFTFDEVNGWTPGAAISHTVEFGENINTMYTDQTGSDLLLIRYAASGLEDTAVRYLTYYRLESGGVFTRQANIDFGDLGKVSSIGTNGYAQSQDRASVMVSGSFAEEDMFENGDGYDLFRHTNTIHVLRKQGNTYVRQGSYRQPAVGKPGSVNYFPTGLSSSPNGNWFVAVDAKWEIDGAPRGIAFVANSGPYQP